MKKFSYIILSLLLVFAPAYAYANTSIGGWTLTDSIIAGANTTIEATNRIAGKAVKSTATLAPKVGRVATNLLKGGGQAALAYAVVEILGEGIDWVLDPANNAVKYKDTTNVGLGGWYHSNPAVFVSDPSADCVAYRSNGIPSFTTSAGRPAMMCLNPSGGVHRWYYQDTTTKPVEKYLPIDTVAAKVISNAEAGHGPSQAVVEAAALEGFALGDADESLYANATEIDADVENPPDTSNPTDPNAPPLENPALEFPAFCTWASPVCLFFSWARQEVSELFVTITALKDWVFEEAPPEKDVDNTLDTKPIPLTPTQVAINFVGSCPAPLTFEYKIYNQTFRPAVPFDPLCKIAILINPVIKICASIAAIYIVAGIRQGST